MDCCRTFLLLLHTPPPPPWKDVQLCSHKNTSSEIPEAMYNSTLLLSTLRNFCHIKPYTRCLKATAKRPTLQIAFQQLNRKILCQSILLRTFSLPMQKLHMLPVLWINSLNPFTLSKATFTLLTVGQMKNCPDYDVTSFYYLSSLL